MGCGHCGGASPHPLSARPSAALHNFDMPCQQRLLAAALAACPLVHVFPSFFFVACCALHALGVVKISRVAARAPHQARGVRFVASSCFLFLGASGLAAFMPPLYPCKIMQYARIFPFLPPSFSLPGVAPVLRAPLCPTLRRGPRLWRLLQRGRACLE